MKPRKLIATEMLFEIEKSEDTKKSAKKIFYSNYSKARKQALRQVSTENMRIMNDQWSQNPEDINSLFIEKEPDYWSDGKKTIRINVVEIKS